MTKFLQRCGAYVTLLLQLEFKIYIKLNKNNYYHIKDHLRQLSPYNKLF